MLRDDHRRHVFEVYERHAGQSRRVGLRGKPRADRESLSWFMFCHYYFSIYIVMLGLSGMNK